MGLLSWLKKVDPSATSGTGTAEAGQRSNGPEFPSCDVLFERFILPWHTAEDRERTGRRPVVRPDIERIAAHGTPASRLCPLTAESADEAVASLHDLALTAAGREENLGLG